MDVEPAAGLDGLVAAAVGAAATTHTRARYLRSAIATGVIDTIPQIGDLPATTVANLASIAARPTVVAEAARHPRVTVRRAAAATPRCDAHTLAALAVDDDDETRANALRTAAARGRLATWQTIRDTVDAAAGASWRDTIPDVAQALVAGLRGHARPTLDAVAAAAADGLPDLLALADAAPRVAAALHHHPRSPAVLDAVARRTTTDRLVAAAHAATRRGSDDDAARNALLDAALRGTTGDVVHVAVLDAALRAAVDRDDGGVVVGVASARLGDAFAWPAADLADSVASALWRHPTARAHPDAGRVADALQLAGVDVPPPGPPARRSVRDQARAAVASPTPERLVAAAEDAEARGDGVAAAWLRTAATLPGRAADAAARTVADAAATFHGATAVAAAAAAAARAAGRSAAWVADLAADAHPPHRDAIDQLAAAPEGAAPAAKLWPGAADLARGHDPLAADAAATLADALRRRSHDREGGHDDGELAHVVAAALARVGDGTDRTVAAVADTLTRVGAAAAPAAEDEAASSPATPRHTGTPSAQLHGALVAAAARLGADRLAVALLADATPSAAVAAASGGAPAATLAAAARERAWTPDVEHAVAAATRDPHHADALAHSRRLHTRTALAANPATPPSTAGRLAAAVRSNAIRGGDADTRLSRARADLAHTLRYRPDDLHRVAGRHPDAPDPFWRELLDAAEPQHGADAARLAQLPSRALPHTRDPRVADAVAADETTLRAGCATDSPAVASLLADRVADRVADDPTPPMWLLARTRDLAANSALPRRAAERLWSALSRRQWNTGGTLGDLLDALAALAARDDAPAAWPHYVLDRAGVPSAATRELLSHPGSPVVARLAVRRDLDDGTLARVAAAATTRTGVQRLVDAAAEDAHTTRIARAAVAAHPAIVDVVAHVLPRCGNYAHPLQQPLADAVAASLDDVVARTLSPARGHGDVAAMETHDALAYLTLLLHLGGHRDAARRVAADAAGHVTADTEQHRPAAGPVPVAASVAVAVHTVAGRRVDPAALLAAAADWHGTLADLVDTVEQLTDDPASL